MFEWKAARTASIIRVHKILSMKHQHVIFISIPFFTAKYDCVCLCKYGAQTMVCARPILIPIIAHFKSFRLTFDIRSGELRKNEAEATHKPTEYSMNRHEVKRLFRISPIFRRNERLHFNCTPKHDSLGARITYQRTHIPSASAERAKGGGNSSCSLIVSSQFAFKVKW